jgi:hypothetical protein
MQHLSMLVAATALLGALPAGHASAADLGRAAPGYAYAPQYVAVVPQISYRCMRWTERCDRRWGIGSPRFARCMWRHDCGPEFVQ